MEHGLAEIYLLKLEAAVRAAKEAATMAATSRFVPVICPPQLGAPLGFRTIQACPKDLPRGRW
jgi:hypothetical protein